MPGKNIAFVGLGVMGYPMAGHLVNKGGHTVTVFNRNPDRGWILTSSATPDVFKECLGGSFVSEAFSGR